MVVEVEVVGQLARERLEPLKPPMRVWTSHIPDGVVAEEARFQWMRTAPAVAPCVEMIMSDHSTTPVWPALPTTITGLGFAAEEKKEPAPMMTG